MKTWMIPVAKAQRFAANDYVSACTAAIDCNLFRKDINNGFSITEGDLTDWKFVPCGEEHEVSAHGVLIPITITEGWTYGDTKVTLDEPIECYFWAEYDEDGVMVGGHCTMTEDGFQSNRS